MAWGILKALVVLPGTVLVIVPAAILYLSRGTQFSPDLQYPSDVTFLPALGFIAAGVFLALKTVSLFTTLGEGTPAPWEPPKKLVISGPYRYVRNPMIIGAIFVLLGEAVLFNSWPIFMWAILFVMANMIYFPLVEEKGLKRRHGEAYEAYMAGVPRWIPRFREWDFHGESDPRAAVWERKE
jgi:protein-S-isoprenylcysteine O-methyltransferase Ste14